jgi:hypothetical protein
LSGTHLWADRFDGSLEDVFDLQDKVALSVAGIIFCCENRRTCTQRLGARAEIMNDRIARVVNPSRRLWQGAQPIEFATL